MVVSGTILLAILGYIAVTKIKSAVVNAMCDSPTGRAANSTVRHFFIW